MSGAVRDDSVDERGVAGFHEAASEFNLLNQPLEVTSTLFSSITHTCSPPPDASKLLLRAKSGASNPGCVITMRMTQPNYQAMLDVALEEAQQGLDEGGVPIGAALFRRDGTLLGRGHNRRVQDGDPSVHGETDAFRNAGRQRTYQDTVIVTTLAPCWYCSGLVKQFGIPTLVVGESRTFQGGLEWLRENGTEIVDMQSQACEELLGGFIAAQPEVWNEDIGEA